MLEQKPLISLRGFSHTAQKSYPVVTNIRPSSFLSSLIAISKLLHALVFPPVIAPKAKIHVAFPFLSLSSYLSKYCCVNDCVRTFFVSTESYPSLETYRI